MWDPSFDKIRLEAAIHANRALHRFGRAEAEWIDVFDVITEAGAVLFFRPLRNLYGAYLPSSITGTVAGILVNSAHPLPLQRFTAAHELGHLLMGHEASLDTEAEILGRPDPRARGNTAIREAMAETFAAHFLMPHARVRDEMQQLSIGREDLTEPVAVYRLSLSFGMSYLATAYHLASLKLISSKGAERLAGTAPKEIKRRILGENRLENPWADVWEITRQSDGETLFVREGDRLVVELTGQATGGYLWELAGADGLAVSYTAGRLPDEAQGDALRYGQPLPQRIHIEWTGRGSRSLEFVHRRPWEPYGAIDRFRIDLVTVDKPGPGLAPNQRPRAA